MCRSELQWEGFTWSVDINTTIAHLEIAASHIVANIKLHPKWYGGDYRIFLTDSAPGHKLDLSVYYNNAGCGARLQIVPRHCHCAVLSARRLFSSKHRYLPFLLLYVVAIDASMNSMARARSAMQAWTCSRLVLARLP